MNFQIQSHEEIEDFNVDNLSSLLTHKEKFIRDIATLLTKLIPNDKVKQSHATKDLDHYYFCIVSEDNASLFVHTAGAEKAQIAFNIERENKKIRIELEDLKVKELPEHIEKFKKLITDMENL